MAQIPYEGDPRFRPMSPWAYVGYSILFAIPIVGFILMIVFAVNDDYIARRNYARSFIIMMVIVLIISVITAIIGLILGNSFLQFIQNNVNLN